MKIAIAPGVYDILPEVPQDLWRSSYLWNYLETIIRDVAKSYGFKEIRTPAFERTELFLRSVGESSDIVSKEMYTFDDKGGRSLSLRPEGTAPAMRAYIENQLNQSSSITKIFYIGPMFRYERAQAGRYRQHHQFGVEVIGVSSPEQEAELIDLLFNLYNRLGLKDLQVAINSIGDEECRAAFKKDLQNYLKEHFEKLSSDSKTRFETNPLRILDSKDPQDQELVANAPCILDYLSPKDKEHFESFKQLLTLLNIPYTVNPLLVRGLDYYNGVVFEITAGQLGAQNSIAGGGRYDGLLKSLGGPDLPSIGFGTGLERILQTMLKQEVPLPLPPKPTLFFVPLGEEAKKTCFSLMQILRKNLHPVEMDLSGRKLNKAMNYANQIGAAYVAVVGDDELKSKEILLKEMATGNTIKASLDRLEKIFE